MHRPGANYSTANGTALAGSDYTAVSGTLTFAPGETTKTIIVQALDDTLFEPSETFTVTLSNPSSGVTISDGLAAGTIQDTIQARFRTTSPSDTAARLLARVGTNRIRFLPSANYSGPAAFTFRAWDRTGGGTDGGTGDASPNAAPTAFGPAVATATITVNAVNDAPSFTRGANQTVLEDAGPQTIANWATALRPYAGPPAAPALDEAGQVLDFLVSTTNSALFAA